VNINVNLLRTEVVQ